MNIQTDYSILQCLNKPDDIVKICKEAGYSSLILCDRNSMSGAIEFYSKCKEVKDKKGKEQKYIKPVIGTCIKVCEMDPKEKDDYNVMYNICLVAKNKTGYQNLLKIISLGNHPDNVLMTKYQKLPRISLEIIKDLTEGVACILADGSEFEKFPTSYTFQKYSTYFKEVYVSVKGYDKNTIYWADVRYVNKEQEEDWEIVQCILLKCTLKELATKYLEVDCPYKKDNSLPSFESYKNHPLYQKTQDFLNSCEEYEILSKPKVPKFPCPDGMSQKEYLTELCRTGWRRRFPKWDDEGKKKKYADRVKMELDVLQSCELDGYFLVVQDYINWAKRQGWLVGHSRGCLDKNVRVIVKGGVKTLEEIQIGDEVISESGDFNRVENKFVYPVDENLLKINTYYGDKNGITLTKDHKVLVSRCHRIPSKFNNSKKGKQYSDVVSTLEWIRADEIKKGDLLFTPKIVDRTIAENQFIDLSKFSNGISLVHDENYCYHHRINGLTKKINQTWKYPRFLECDKDFYYLLGVFAGDGWLLKQSKNKFGLCFNTDDEEDIERIIRYLQKLGLTFRKKSYESKKLLQIIVSCHHLTCYLREVFDKYQYTSQTKHVPNFIKEASDVSIQAFLQGYISADGSIEKPYMCTMSTSSKTLYDDLKYLFTIINIPVRCGMTKKKEDIRGYKSGIEYTISSNQRIILGCKKDSIKAYQWKKIDNGYLTRVRSIVEVEGIKEVYDIQVANEHNYLTTSGLVHNSSGGSLVAYLLRITEIDSILFNLSFERFYSADRSAGGVVSLPDIDTDFPKDKRQAVIHYIMEKYGKNRVVHMSTYGTLKASGVITAVLSSHDVFDHKTIKSITKRIPQQDKVSDKMEEQNEKSLIRFVLKNFPDTLKELGQLEGDTITGEHAYYLEQAIRLEGLNSSVGIHASGILISDIDVVESCPLIINNDGDELLCAFEMSSSEKAGLVKVDILATEVLDKCMEIQNLLLGTSEDQ